MRLIFRVANCDSEQILIINLVYISAWASGHMLLHAYVRTCLPGNLVALSKSIVSSSRIQ
ncbi:Os02g0193350 [Oryza sativa Japonica Group]|uniref:Os02g0193350 protein n=2 Tax=Oryza sativa subsp. japonica TaxID=39947 RepID=B9F3T5_ORYSJ|nr:hypothetical protein OsJ_05722 [Oryza sativa Japonica Group]KAB8086263.1 hypothetical protein EE612_009464 [Oryza sativa]BAS77427.1 Os02g0193350 [Oryza sativa Japonica Group]